jgi:DNA-binding MarR family transcriptional regulator
MKKSSTPVELIEDVRVAEAVRLFRCLSRMRMRDAFEPWRKMDVPLAQLKSLFIIHARGSASVRSLALDLGVTPANVTGIIDRLVSQDLVSRGESTSDRRIVRLQLTDKGRAKISTIQESGFGKMPKMLKEIPPAELTCLLSGLNALVAAFERERTGKVETGKGASAKLETPISVTSNKLRRSRPAC